MSAFTRTRKDASLGQAYVTRSRTDRRCDLCDWTIPAYDPHITWTLPPSWHEGDDWWTAHVHALCYVIYQHSDWSDPDEPLPFFADFRSEVLALVESVEVCPGDLVSGTYVRWREAS